MSVPKPPAFDAQTSAKAWTDGVKKPDGTLYAAFGKFPDWKQWVDKQRDYLASVQTQANDQKKHLDENTSDLRSLEDRVAALEAQPPGNPFPG